MILIMSYEPAPLVGLQTVLQRDWARGVLFSTGFFDSDFEVASSECSCEYVWLKMKPLLIRINHRAIGHSGLRLCWENLV